jgi:hypothetical protein
MVHTWDKDRPETSLEHVLADYRDGGIGTLGQAYWEHLSFVHPIHTGERLEPEEIEAQVREDIKARPDAHFHAWTGAGFRRILDAISSSLGFMVICQLFVVNENIFVLEKRSVCEHYGSRFFSKYFSVSKMYSYWKNWKQPSLQREDQLLQ